MLVHQNMLLYAKAIKPCSKYYKTEMTDCYTPFLLKENYHIYNIHFKVLNRKQFVKTYVTEKNV